MKPSVRPSGQIEYPVDVVREGWSEHELEDGTILRSRMVVLKAVFPPGSEDLPKGSVVQVDVATSPVSAAFVPPNLRGPPSVPTPTQSELLAAAAVPVKVLASNEVWNLYRIPGKPGALKFKQSLTSIRRCKSYFNADGEPIYLLNFSAAGGPISEEELASELGATSPSVTKV